MEGSGVAVKPLAKSELWFTTAQTVSLPVFTPQSPNVMSPDPGTNADEMPTLLLPMLPSMAFTHWFVFGFSHSR